MPSSMAARDERSEAPPATVNTAVVARLAAFALDSCRLPRELLAFLAHAVSCPSCHIIVPPCLAYISDIDEDGLAGAEGWTGSLSVLQRQQTFSVVVNSPLPFALLPDIHEFAAVASSCLAALQPLPESAKRLTRRLVMVIHIVSPSNRDLCAKLLLSEAEYTLFSDFLDIAAFLDAALAAPPLLGYLEAGAAELAPFQAAILHRVAWTLRMDASGRSERALRQHRLWRAVERMARARNPAVVDTDLLHSWAYLLDHLQSGNLLDPEATRQLEKRRVTMVCGRYGCPVEVPGVGYGREPSPPAAGGAALSLCARCRLVRYCSAACQRADWPLHRAVCGKRCMGEVDFGEGVRARVAEVCEVVDACIRVGV